MLEGGIFFIMLGESVYGIDLSTYEIEEVIADMDIVDEELDDVSASISERDYYQNTNK